MLFMIKQQKVSQGDAFFKVNSCEFFKMMTNLLREKMSLSCCRGWNESLQEELKL